MKAKRYPKGSYASRAIDYAKRVVSGKIPACWQMRAACQRTLDDLNRTDLIFSVEHIDHACAFMEALVHIKGQWAGQPFLLADYQVWIVANLFGFLNADDRLRRFREAFCLLPRKMGKSAFASAIGLYMCFADGEAGAEVYCGATNLAQANEVFRPARLMAQQSPGFIDSFGVEVMAKSIFVEATGQSFTPVIGKTKDGSSPHCAITDELHQAKDDTQVQAFRTGMGARQQPLLLMITTAGFNIAGVCRTEQLTAEGVLRGDVVDDTVFVAIYTIDAGDDWRNFDSWIKANPGLNISVGEKYLRTQLAKAIQSPANAAAMRTKHLNEWIASAAGWLNQNDWANAANPSLDYQDFEGCPAWIGVDMSTKQDLTAISVVVQTDDGKRAIFPFSFLPQGAIDGGRNATAYASWMSSQELIVTDGNASDFAEIEAQLSKLVEHFDIQMIVFDPWQGENSRQKFAAQGYETSIWQANSRGEWTIAMDDFEADLKNGKLVHPDNAVLNWCAANICAHHRGVTRVPVKPAPNSEQKIDAMVAALMAFAASNIIPAPVTAPTIEWFD